MSRTVPSPVRAIFDRDAARRRVSRAAMVFLAIFPVAGSALLSQQLPFASGEQLVYDVSWPSGLSLGEVRFRAESSAGRWSFQADVNASLPTLAIADEYRSTADAELCSLELRKKVSRDEKKTGETVTYDQRKLEAQRKAIYGDGESVLKINPCTRDGLTYFYHLRAELASGRIPPPDDVNFGSQYEVIVSYVETLEIGIAGESRPADRLLIDISGPASSHSFEIFIGKDAARTPLLILVPLELGTFSLKLVP